MSISRHELQEELTRTKDEIVSSVKALSTFTKVELDTSSKRFIGETKNIIQGIMVNLQEKINEMVSKNQAILQGEDARANATMDNIERMLSENKSTVQALAQSRKVFHRQKTIEMTEKN